MDPRLRAVAEHQGGAFTSSDAARVDVGESALRHLTRRGEVVHVRRGAYVLADVWASATPEGRLALRTIAVLRTRPAALTAKDHVPAPDAATPDAASHQAALALTTSLSTGFVSTSWTSCPP
ncbi:type IV toxin-antitoxin system AbiEi family antitoxin domain-containing protein [Knoellia locipacati]|uniref:type IV toxin-antitoxin system AbiEi family antitoxin domain-containing protein n=1 Tax=Knoellia locipacati TaxID=882824 RepID=UPI00384B2EFA